MSAHPLANLIADVAAGRHPAVDGSWQRVSPWRPGLEAVVALTGHAVLAVGADVSGERLIELGVNGFGGAHDPRLLSSLAGPHAWIDSLDVLLVRRGTEGLEGPPQLVPRPDLQAHPRVLFAQGIRDDPLAYGYKDSNREAVVVLARGIGGLTELSFELEPHLRGTGDGTRLVEAALTLVPSDELVVAAAAPGNAASLRTLLSAGFLPFGSVQLFRRGSAAGS